MSKPGSKGWPLLCNNSQAVQQQPPQRNAFTQVLVGKTAFHLRMSHLLSWWRCDFSRCWFCGLLRGVLICHTADTHSSIGTGSTERHRHLRPLASLVQQPDHVANDCQPDDTTNDWTSDPGQVGLRLGSWVFDRKQGQQRGDGCSVDHLVVYQSLQCISRERLHAKQQQQQALAMALRASVQGFPNPLHFTVNATAAQISPLSPQMRERADPAYSTTANKKLQSCQPCTEGAGS